MRNVPLTWICDHLVYARSTRDPWAVFALACETHDRRSESERLRHFVTVRALLLDLGADVQLLRPHSWWDPDLYLAERLADGISSPHARAREAYLREQAQEIDGAWQPGQTFLAVSLLEPRRHAKESASDLLADPAAELGRWRGQGRKLALAGARLDPEALAAHHKRADEVGETIATRLPGSLPASRGQLEWLVRRAWTRGLGDPVCDDAPPEPPPTAEVKDRRVLAPRPADLLGWTGYLQTGSRRDMVADGEFGPSHQVGLLAGTMPGDGQAGDEVLELLFGPQDDLAFPVDLAVCCRYVSPERAAAQVKSEMARADEQLDEQDEAKRGASDQTLLRSQTAHDAEAYLSGGLPLWECTFSVLIGAETQEQAQGRAREAISSFRGRGVSLRIALGQQRQVFLEHLPAQRSWTTGFVRRLTVEQLAAMAPTATHRLGLRHGYVWGLSDKSPTVMRFCPEDGSRLNLASGVLVVGDSGAGKTTLAAKMAHEAFLDGSAIFDFVGKADDHHWHKNPVIDPHAVSVELDDVEDLEGLLDPWINAPRMLAFAGTLDFLTSLLPMGIPPVWHTELQQAARGVQLNVEHPTNWAVIDALKARGNTGGEVAEHLESQASSGLARLGFSRDAHRRLGLRQVTHLQMESLPVPEPGVARSEWSVSERQGAALMKLITLLGLGVLSAWPDAYKLFFFDEAKTILDHADGRRMIDSLQRLGRSKKASAVVGTQYATDIGSKDRSVGGLFGAVIVFRAPDEPSATRSCELLGLPADPGLVREISALPSGTAFVRDQRGQVELVEIRLTRSLATQAQTNPYARRQQQDPALELSGAAA